MAVSAGSAQPSKAGVTTLFEWERNGLADTAATLLIILVMHNVLLYCVGSVMAGFFDVEFGVAFPFQHKEFGFQDKAQLARWTTTAVTWPCTALVMGFFFRTTLRPWDHMLSLSLAHFVIVCAVSANAPTTPEWWVTFVVVAIVTAALPPQISKWCDGFFGRRFDS